jgi:hypothetical protein
MQTKHVFVPVVVLAIIICLACSPLAVAADSGSLDNFTEVQYYSGQFTDVPISSWSIDYVIVAYEYGLMKGAGATSFNPAGNITLAETIAIACRMHSIYYADGQAFTQASPWYQIYVDYALINGIIDQEYVDYTAPATRAEFAAILSRALPAAALTPTNTVDDGMIPDVEAGAPYHDAVYLLYRAGILTGSNAERALLPDSPIRRDAAAAIVSRMIFPDWRIIFTLTYGNASINFNTTASSVSLTPGEEQTIYINNTCDEAMTMHYEVANNGVADVEWGEWVDENNYSCELKIYGILAGSTVVTITNDLTNETINITVTVSAKQPAYAIRPIASTTLLYLKVGETKTVSFSYYTNIKMTIMTFTYGSEVSVPTWQFSTDSQAELSVVGLKPGSNRILVHNDLTSEFLVIWVVVTDLNETP